MATTAPALAESGVTEELIQLGVSIYERRLRHSLERTHAGEFVAVHVDSGDYAIGRSAVAAIKEFRKHHPADGRLFIQQIGDEPEYEIAKRLTGESRRAES